MSGSSGDDRGLVRAWKRSLARPGFLLQFLAALVVLTAVMIVFRGFLDRVESRPGVVLADPLLSHFAPRNVSIPVFVMLNGSLLFGVYRLAHAPERLVAALWAYAGIVATRMLAMHLVPLDPPPTLIPLTDPFVEAFGDHRTLTRDLFFSGHTAILTLLTLAAPSPRSRGILFVSTLLVAGGVLAQHAHYAVDVLVAPFVSFAWWRICAARVDTRG
ncbi:MAG: phosphatase PAP2-related protein [Polyangiaceae bacterium]